MQIKMKMPDLATSASVVTILKWLVEVGQPIKRGQPLLEIETDKAAMEVESFANGTLSAVHFQANDEVEVGGSDRNDRSARSGNSGTVTGTTDNGYGIHVRTN